MTTPPEKRIESFAEYVEYVEDEFGGKEVLFRGQPCDKPLLPPLARIRQRKGSVLDVEAEMLDDFKRKSIPYLPATPETDWDWLAWAQHHGMATRLLDWSSNPLAALWFAVSKPCDAGVGVVWAYKLVKGRIATSLDDIGPFDQVGTRVFRPRHLTQRIVAQSAWFTVHRYVRDEDVFIALEKNRNYKPYLVKMKITSPSFPELRASLRRFGVTHASMFPDLGGLCQHIVCKHCLLPDESKT